MFSLLLFLLGAFIVNSKKFSFAGAVANALADDSDIDDIYFEDYIAYAQKFGKDKKYDLDDEDELKRRYQNFYNSQVYLNDMNKKSLSFEVGHTKFSDLDDEEKKALLMQEFSVGTSETCTQLTMSTDSELDDLSSDFRSYDIGIQDQDTCSCCWDFSIVGMMEINRNLDVGISEKLSEQMVLDCTPTSVGTCDGGYPIQASEWVQSNGGLLSESDYGSYQDEELTCSYDSDTQSDDLVNMIDMYCLSDESKDQFTMLVSKYAAEFAFEVYYDFYFYTSGVYECTENSGEFQGWHAVSAIGLTSTYYIVKNSWGTDWGINGYLYMSKDGFDTCSMSQITFATYNDISDDISDDILSVDDISRTDISKKSKKSKKNKFFVFLYNETIRHITNVNHLLYLLSSFSIILGFLAYKLEINCCSNNTKKLSNNKNFRDYKLIEEEVETDYLLSDQIDYGTVAL